MFYKIIFAISATVLPSVIGYFIKQSDKRKSYKKQSTKCNPDCFYYQCMFWTMNNIKCREHLLNNIECGVYCSTAHLQTILKLLSSAKLSIHMCMYHLTMKQVTDELIKAHNRGVVVKIITDHVTSKMEHSKVKLLESKYGLEVKTSPYEDSYMHHKYCLVDAEDSQLQKMFFGSLNLTLQGFAANFEFVVITNDLPIISSYRQEFELLWDTFKTSNFV